MPTKSILYYTGNAKSPEFEARVRETLVENSQGLPIVSVSHTPIPLGKNICVGNVGHSYLNVHRQMLIGAREVETEYLFFAEDDFLYPKEYFSFDPTADFYRYNNAWMVLWRGRYYKMHPTIGVIKRDVLIRELEIYLDGEPMWADNGYAVNKPEYNAYPYEFFDGLPVISFKTTGNLSRSGTCAGPAVSDLPIWGNVNRLRRKYCG